MIAVPVDPFVIHCQWEIAPADLEHAKGMLGVGDQEYWPVLHVYDVTNGAHAESGRHAASPLNVQLAAENWYVRSCSPERAYRADLALRREDGGYAVVASSNVVETPPSGPSNHAEQPWSPIRLQPREPDLATPVLSPIDLEPQASWLPAPDPPGEFAPSAPPPVEMSEEVHRTLTDLYRDLEPQQPVLPFPSPPPLPVDMREEVIGLLTHVYPGVEKEPPVFTEGLFSFERSLAEYLARQGLEMNSGVLAHWLGMSSGLSGRAALDLTELNERSFTSGISSASK